MRGAARGSGGQKSARASRVDPLPLLTVDLPVPVTLEIYAKSYDRDRVTLAIRIRGRRGGHMLLCRNGARANCADRTATRGSCRGVSPNLRRNVAHTPRAYSSHLPPDMHNASSHAPTPARGVALDAGVSRTHDVTCRLSATVVSVERNSDPRFLMKNQCWHRRLQEPCSLSSAVHILTHLILTDEPCGLVFRNVQAATGAPEVLLWAQLTSHGASRSALWVRARRPRRPSTSCGGNSA